MSFGIALIFLKKKGGVSSGSFIIIEMCFKPKREKKYDHFCREKRCIFDKSGHDSAAFLPFPSIQKEKVSVCDMFSNPPTPPQGPLKF